MAKPLSSPPRRLYALSAYLRRRFGQPVRKIPLDPGGACPNRTPQNPGGCLYCDDLGSGTGLHGQGLSLAEQWLALTARLSVRQVFDFCNKFEVSERDRNLLVRQKVAVGKILRRELKDREMKRREGT